MSCPCCSGVAEMFDERLAERDARKYRRRGLDRPSRRIVELLRPTIEGAEVLEIGGGNGTVEIELLRSGASAAAIVELSPGYERVAGELLREAGFEARVSRVVGDLLADPSLAGEADVAVLNRVVCCTPDGPAVVDAAAARARRRIVLTFPPDNAFSRLAVAVLNLVPRLRGSSFRAFVHPRAAILAPAEARGFRVDTDRRAGVWRLVALSRP